MQLQDYISVIRKRWWIIGLITVVAAVSAYGFSKMQTPIYRSQAKYVVVVSRLDSGANFSLDKILSGYVNLVYRPDRMETVAQRLQIDRTGQQLMEYVRLQPQPNESLIVIEADYFDPQTSQRIADEVGRELNAQVVEKNRVGTGEDRLSLDLAPAQYAGIASPKTRINVLAGAILGLVLGTLLAFVLEYLDDTLKTSGDVERFTDLVTIGAIPGGAAQGGRAGPRWRPAPSAGIVASSAPQQRTTHDQ